MTDWTYVELAECDSTFIEARRHPAWTAVNAVEQHAGRGRFNRRWFGEAGGLWVCYNLPIDSSLQLDWGLLPLLAGTALMRALEPYQIPHLRLRWPNDLLVGRAKLAGILVEKPRADMASVGIGVNIANDTLALRGLTLDPPARLQDYSQPCPSVHEFRAVLAAALEYQYKLFIQGGMAALMPDLERAWGEPRPVVAITDTARHCGFFTGVNSTGSPLLRFAHGEVRAIPGIEINRLAELL